jgi:hypothetical protein
MTKNKKEKNLTHQVYLIKYILKNGLTSQLVPVYPIGQIQTSIASAFS